MRNRIEQTLGQMPRFWPPKPSRVWRWLLTPNHHRLLRNVNAIVEVNIEGMERLAAIPPEDGVLICPNHSYTGDGVVMMDLARRCPRMICIMAAWHVFTGHWGIDGFLLQRVGCFSVDREGADRRAIRTAIELLSTGRGLIIFPEGEIYHLNEKLTPLREGVAFIGVCAQRELDKAASAGRVWLVPSAIRYRFTQDVTPALEQAMAELERRVVLKTPPGLALPERIIRFGEMMLTIKEKEQLGRSYDDEGQTLPGRTARLMSAMLDRLEQKHLGRTQADEPVPVRVKLLRHHLLERLSPAEESGAAVSQVDATLIRDALADVHLVVQLFSYPGDYISTRPTPERMAETIEKYEEDVYGTAARPKGPRRATVVIGEPIDVRAQLAAGKARAAATELTVKLEAGLQALMSRP
jgi:1-acyl-sn-glycerol-3-phosphate acyltransferase